MAQNRQKSKTVKIQTSNLTTFFATLSGVVIGVIASLAMVGPMVRSEVASATRDLQVRPVSSVSECYSPNDEGGTSSTAKPKSPAPKPGGGSGGGGGSGSDVEKIVYSNTTVASMKNTGPDSNNEITTINRNTTTITNNNNVSVVNQNNQQASSGSATVSGNTNGGNAGTGNAANTNKVTTEIDISN